MIDQMHCISFEPILLARELPTNSFVKVFINSNGGWPSLSFLLQIITGHSVDPGTGHSGLFRAKALPQRWSCCGGETAWTDFILNGSHPSIQWSVTSWTTRTRLSKPGYSCTTVSWSLYSIYQYKHGGCGHFFLKKVKKMQLFIIRFTYGLKQMPS